MKAKKIISGLLAAGMLAGYALFPNGAELFAIKASAAEGDVAINAANFPDAEFRNYIFKNFDIDQNDILSKEEIENITAIEFYKADSYEGIQFFKALKSLTVGGYFYNHDPEFSLNLSQCVDLEELQCADCVLTDLDIRGCTALKELYCTSTSLKSLDVSTNTALEVLYAGGNSLTELNLSNNKALRSLECNTNQLKTLDLTNNPNLIYVDCSQNQLTELDLSNNKALINFNCGLNKFSFLNMSGYTELKKLQCYNNQITQVDVSDCTSLEELILDNNLIVSINISGCSELEKLSCTYNKLTSLNISDSPNLSSSYGKPIEYYGNSYNIGTVVDYYDLSNLPDGFDPLQASNWNGATYSDGKLTNFTSLEVTYDYYCGRGKSVSFKLVADKYIDSSAVEINEANFPDPAFREYVAKNFDGNGDGMLSVAEISMVTEINVGGEYDKIGNITSLKGIEYFTKLSSLYCGYNKIAELDVSKNTALEKLYCYVNQLTSLDVSQNAALAELSCGRNQLTKLNVGKNTKLNFLSCYSNILTELDVSSNPMLETFTCSGNQLTKLDIGSNPNLLYLYCDNNQLIDLDTSKNSKLCMLFCQYNNIKKLNLSDNGELFDLDTDINITIYGISGTMPEEYAKANGIKFIDINAPLPAVSGTITVSSKDSVSGTVIELTGSDGKKHDVDISGGSFSASDLINGVYKLLFTKSKYCPREYTVTVEDGVIADELSVKLQKYGDIDNTGEINISDALQIVNYRNSKTSSFDKVSGDELDYLKKLADINGDGTVNINDALQIVNFRNGKKSAFDDIA